MAAEFLNKSGEPCSPDFAAVARAFGAYSERIQKGEEVKPALERAFAANKPAVIEVIVDRGYPSSNRKSTGWWDVPIPSYLKKKP